MMDSTRLLALASAWVVLAGAASVQTPGKISIMIRGTDASVHAGEKTTLGQYYTVQYALPDNLASEHVERAMLEVYVDVRAKTREDYINEAPMLEVYAPTEPFAGGVDLKKLDVATRAGRPIALGEKRLVRIDVTRIVRAHASKMLANNGLVIGSLSGMREGDFAIVAGMFPDGAIGRLNIYTSDPVK